MDKSECFNLGYISKKVGNKGELAFVLDVDDPARYKKLESVFIEINNSLIPFFIKKIQIRGNMATVSIEGVDTIEQAEKLIKSGLYLPLTLLPELRGKKFYFHEMPGFTVVDKNHGNIGVIKSVLEFPQQIIFQILKDGHEILIPANERFIIQIDRNEKRLEIEAPEGLIDIYISEKKPDESEKETDED